jgi:branched-chain amino acid transport system permease protein
MQLLLITLLNGLTLAGLYFLLASGFTLIFGLMRYVNMAHGSILLFAAYVGYFVQDATGHLWLAVSVGILAAACLGGLLELVVFRKMSSDEMRQTLVTIGLSIVAADLMLWGFGAQTYQMALPLWLDVPVAMPIINRYPLVRLTVMAVAVAVGLGLWAMLRWSRLGLMIRAGVDDKQMLSSVGISANRLFVGVFALGAGLAGLAGVMSGAMFSIAPGEDVRYLLGSLMVVIVGGMGSIGGAALGALFIGVAEQLGIVYSPTYGSIYMFVVMALVLALKPRGLFGVRYER